MNIENLINAWIKSAENNIAEDHVYSDCRIHDIWNIFRILAKYKQWKSMDILLESIDAKKIPLDDVISILTCTAWYKENLTKRADFFNKVQKRWDCRKDGILKGLK